MRIRAQHSVVLRLLAALFVTTIVATDAATSALAQAGSGAAGTVKGFVRVNGKTLAVNHATAVTAPDSFDPSQEVRLVLITPTPITAATLAKATDRNAVFGLVPAGAIVEIGKNGHTVFLFHSALGGQRLQTGGGFPEFKNTTDRVSGDVHTFMSGDQDEFGFKVRFELAFDAPIVKRLPLAKATTTATAKPTPVGPLPKTKEEAKKWLADQGYGVADGSLMVYFALGVDASKPLNANVVRAYLTMGVNVNRKSEFTGDAAINALTIVCPGQAAATEVTRLLLDAGADVNIQEPESRKATPIMGAVFCPEVFPLILAKKPNLNPLDARGKTVMHYALDYGKPDMPRMLLDAGFDMARWRKSLVDEYGESRIEEIGAPPAASVPPARAAAIDWKGLGPYPDRSKAEAAKLLSRPGAMTTIDDHFWDGITRHEPQRLALALQAGANVKQLRPVVGYTPLLMLADRCDERADAEAQVSVADQLIAAGADLTGLDSNKANALIVAVNHCPIGVIRSLIKAGMPLQAATTQKSTALQAAILAERVDVIEALLDAGLDPKKEPYNVGKFTAGNKAIEAALKKKRK